MQVLRHGSSAETFGCVIRSGPRGAAEHFRDEIITVKFGDNSARLTMGSTLTYSLPVSSTAERPHLARSTPHDANQLGGQRVLRSRFARCSAVLGPAQR